MAQQSCAAFLMVLLAVRANATRTSAARVDAVLVGFTFVAASALLPAVAAAEPLRFSQTVLLNTSQGTLRGNRLVGSDEFLGFPFGEAPRFAAPTLRSKPFVTQPFDATYYGPACLANSHI